MPATLPLGFVTGWLGPQGGSAFPLLPYSGYVFAGAVLGKITILVLIILFIQKRPRGMFALKGRAVEA